MERDAIDCSMSFLVTLLRFCWFLLSFPWRLLRLCLLFRAMLSTLHAVFVNIRGQGPFSVCILYWTIVDGFTPQSCCYSLQVRLTRETDSISHRALTEVQGASSTSLPCRCGGTRTSMCVVPRHLLRCLCSDNLGINVVG